MFSSDFSQVLRVALVTAINFYCHSEKTFLSVLAEIIVGFEKNVVKMITLCSDNFILS